MHQRLPCFPVVALVAGVLLGGAAPAQQFTIEDFANVGPLSLNGVTQPVVSSDGPVLRLVDAVLSSNGRSGSCFYTTPFRIERCSGRIDLSPRLEPWGADLTLHGEWRSLARLGG